MNLWQKAGPHLYLNTQTGFYYARKSKKGKGRLFVSTGETKKMAAQTKADMLVAKFIHGERKDESVKVRDVVERLDKELDRLHSTKGADGRPLRRDSTRRKDYQMLALITLYFGDEAIGSIDEGTWERWVTNVGRPSGRQTFNDIGKYLSKVLTFAMREKYITRKPRIAAKDKQQDEIVIYTREQIEAVLAHASPTLRDLIIIGAEMGLRPGENNEMRWDWIAFGESHVELSIPAWAEKRGKARHIIVSDNAAQVLKRRYEARGTSPFVFPSLKDPNKPLNRWARSKLWRIAAKSAGFPDSTKFHWLRHSFFTHALVEAKLSLAQVSAYGGNSPKILFERYLAKDAEKTREVAGAMKLTLSST